MSSNNRPDSLVELVLAGAAVALAGVFVGSAIQRSARPRSIGGTINKELATVMRILLR